MSSQLVWMTLIIISLITVSAVEGKRLPLSKRIDRRPGILYPPSETPRPGENGSKYQEVYKVSDSSIATEKK